jgi:hypothetical protein
MLLTFSTQGKGSGSVGFLDILVNKAGNFSLAETMLIDEVTIMIRGN